MRVNLMIFSIMVLGLLLIASCATKKLDERLNIQWEFMEFPPGRTMACTDQKGVEQIRERLIRCGELSSDGH